MTSKELEKIRQRIDRLFGNTSDSWLVREKILYEDAPRLLDDVERLRRIYIYARTIINIKDTVSISGEGADHMNRAFSDLHEELENEE